MRARYTSRLVVLSVATLLTGCVDLVGLIDGRPDSYVERDGLSYQVIVDESPYEYDVFEYRIRITNTSHRTIERWLPVRLGTPRVYRDERWRHPVWSACDWGCEHYGDRVRVRLRAGEAVEGWWGEVWAGDFAHRRGTYHLVLLIDTGHHRFEVLGLPELHVW